MEEYAKQYVRNEVIFFKLLEILADRLYTMKIEKIITPLGRNYGFVFSFLTQRLMDHKPPLDASLEFVKKGEKTVGEFYIKHPKNSSFS